MPRVLGIPHELRDLGEHAIAHTAIAGTGTVSELSVGFVYNHRDRAHRFEQGQDPLQIAFRYPLPHAAKILQCHCRNPDLAGEASGDESFPRTHRPADYVAHGQDIGVAGVDGFGGILQLALGLVVSGDKRQVKSALHKLQQTAGLRFNQILLTVREKL